MSQCISVVIIGFVIVTMHNAIANFLLLFCRMMYCQLTNIGLDTGHTGFDTSLLDLDFTLATSDWMLATQLCSNITCVQLFKNQQINFLVASYISRVFF